MFTLIMLVLSIVGAILWFEFTCRWLDASIMDWRVSNTLHILGLMATIVFMVSAVWFGIQLIMSRV